jgi:hypothetical protein
MAVAGAGVAGLSAKKPTRQSNATPPTTAPRVRPFRPRKFGGGTDCGPTVTDPPPAASSIGVTDGRVRGAPEIDTLTDGGISPGPLLDGLLPRLVRGWEGVGSALV